MYVHLPFCEARCTFCGCNVVISPRRGPEEDYLDALERELDLLAEALGDRRQAQPAPLGWRHTDLSVTRRSASGSSRASPAASRSPPTPRSPSRSIPA